MTDVYTINEVAQHNNAEDLWIVIHGVVYNITKFYKEHPGGEEVLLKLAGQDATDCFETVGHSYEAINLRENFKIGKLVDGVNSDKSKMMNTEIKEPMEDLQDDWQYQEAKEQTSSSTSSWLIYFSFVIYAIIIYYWFRKLTS